MGEMGFLEQLDEPGLERLGGSGPGKTRMVVFQVAVEPERVVGVVLVVPLEQLVVAWPELPAEMLAGPCCCGQSRRCLRP